MDGLNDKGTIAFILVPGEEGSGYRTGGPTRPVVPGSGVWTTLTPLDVPPSGDEVGEGRTKGPGNPTLDSEVNPDYPTRSGIHRLPPGHP